NTLYFGVCSRARFRTMLSFVSLGIIRFKRYAENTGASNEIFEAGYSRALNLFRLLDSCRYTLRANVFLGGHRRGIWCNVSNRVSLGAQARIPLAQPSRTVQRASCVRRNRVSHWDTNLLRNYWLRFCGTWTCHSPNIFRRPNADPRFYDNSNDSREEA